MLQYKSVNNTNNKYLLTRLLLIVFQNPFLTIVPIQIHLKLHLSIKKLESTH